MKRIINWINRWSFLILVFLLGTGYLTLSGHWRVYAESLAQIRGLLPEGGLLLTDSGSVSGGSVSDGSISGGNVSDGNVSGGNADAENPSGGNPVNSENGGGNPDGAADRNGADGTETAANPGLVQAEGELTDRKPEDVVYHSVEDEYFRDAVFIGDSRTVGLYEYGKLEEISTFYASTGLTVYKMFDAPIVEAEGRREKQTIEQALSERSFSRIYLMIGINEMGTGDVDSFMEAYQQALEHLRELQPDAVIYLQSIMKVTTERSERGDYINNEGIEERNARIAKLADNKSIYYLDVNSVICDETGGMEASYTFDGVHLKAQYVSLWKDFLKSHAVDKVLLD